MIARRPLEPVDGLLLGAFVLVAALGTWTRCLMVNDGAVLLSAVWLGDAWDLYLRQITGRSVSTLVLFGPAWMARAALGLSSDAFMVVAHALYFAAPLGLWLLVRRVEPSVIFSRLYLALSLSFVYFPSELIVGIGLWMSWAAIATGPTYSTAKVGLATLVLGIVIIFTHPATTLMSALYLGLGAALALAGRPFPRRTLIAAAGMTVLLLAGYLLTSAFLRPTNPTIVRALAENQTDFVDPWWMMATLGRSPMLLALWLLLIAPGTLVARLRWQLPPPAVLVIAGFGLWFAANGVTQVTWIYARHAGVHVLVLALALAAVSPNAWLEAARRPLACFAAIMTIAAVSYSIDLVLLERFVRAHQKPGYWDAEALPAPSWPGPRQAASLQRVFFKWTAGADYVRDVVVPDYDWYLLTLAFQSFFLSERTSVLYHRISDAGWVPYECPPVKRALDWAHDERDAAFLRFMLTTGYCIAPSR